MIGSIAFNPIAIAINDGRINITPDISGASKDSSYILVTAQGSPDDLRFIDGATKNGQIFWLQGTQTQIINLKAATLPSISLILGEGTVSIITVTNHNLTTNDKINILNTTNFNENNVTVTVASPTIFTYPSVGDPNFETSGLVQDGNFVTDTGDDVVLDGTKSLHGVPMIPIIFDPTVVGNGAWRPAQILSVNGGGGVSTLSQLTIDVNKDWQALGISNFGPLTGVTSLDMDGIAATIQGVSNIDFFQASHSINSLAGVMLFQINTLDEYNFSIGGTEVLKIDEAAASVYRLDMLAHSIHNAKDILIDDSAGAVTFAGTAPALGFDSVASRLILNLPAAANLFVTNNNTIGSTQMNNSSISSNIINASEVLQLGVDVTVPSGVGEFRNDGTDVKVFSGGAVRNLSDIVIGANTALSNLVTTSINAALLPQASNTLDFGSELLPWRIAHVREIEFVTNASVPNASSDTQISKNVSGNLAFNNAAAGGGFLYYFEGVNTWSMTSTTLTGPNHIIQESLNINDSVTDPSFAGEFRRNAADVKVFTGGVVKNLSDIGADSPLTTKGDIFTFDTADARLPVGSNGQVLTANSAVSLGVEWAAGGGFSEPIELGFNEVVTQTPPTLTVIAGDIFNPSHIDLDQDIELQLDISATASKYKSIFVIFDTTGGGFTVTWPASVVNPPIIPDTIVQRISVILYTINNGVLWTHATSVGSSSGAEFFGPWTANHDAGVNALVNLSAVAIVDAGGLPRGSISGDAGATAVRLSLATGNKFIISDVLTDIATFDDTTGLTIEGSHVINMGNNIINSISELQLSNLNAHTPSNELSIAFDNIDDELKYSVALTTDAHSWYADTDRLASIVRTGVDQGQLNIHDVISDILQANTQFIILDSSTDPGFNGEFRRNSTDVKVFSGGAVRNLSDIGTGGSGANQQLDNLTGTVRPNQDLLADQSTGGNLGSSTPGDEWFNLFSRRVTFSAATSLGAGDYSFGRVNTPNRVQYNVPTGAIHRWTINGTNEMELSNVELILNGVDLNMENNNIFDINQLQIMGVTGDTLRGFISSAGAGFLDITSDENDSHVRIFARDNGGVITELIDVNGQSKVVNLGQGGLSFGEITNLSTINRVGNDLNIAVSSIAELNLDIGTNTKINIRDDAVEFFTELIMDGSNQIDFAQGVNSATIGSANALPGLPAGYIVCKVGTVDARIPFWNV